ncbi:MAG: DNA primase [SAR116 cluster bacterium]|nr:DNA primase [SAR116 cluster bacterium]
MLTEEFIKELRDSMSLSTIISKKVRLVKKGKNFIGLCPFHNEKTPSFNVNDDEGYYHCFGCGAHGDSISFIRNYENKSFMEAVETISYISGIKLPALNSDNIELLNEKKNLLKLIKLSTQFYSRSLFTLNGKDALQYVKSRGLQEETIKKFILGYAPQTGLKAYLNSEGFRDDILIKAGLLRENSDGSISEVFRNRLIFPIFDRKSNPIAFGGRAMFNSKAKYLNSPNSILFQKSECLYGLSHLTRDDFKTKPLLIVEGYMDVISINQSKIAQGVAPLGTAISENQIETIWKLNNKLVLCLDGDKAGEIAAWRFINRVLPILNIGKEISFAWLPENHDPDDMLRNSNKDHFEAIIRNPSSLIDTIWKILRNKYNDTNPDSKAQLRVEAKKTVNLIKNNDIRQSYMDEVYQRIKDSRTSNQNYLSSDFIKRPSVGRQSILNSIFLILICHPQLVMDFSEKIVKLDFKNNFKNKIVLILLDMVIKNPTIDRNQFSDHLDSLNMSNTLNELDTKLIIKRLGYDPGKIDTKNVSNNFSELLERILNENKRI